MTMIDQNAALQQEYVKALDLHNRGLIEEAEQIYRSILRWDPRNVGALYSLGVIHLSRSEYRAAEQRFAQAVLAEPGNVVAHINLGVALKRLGRLEESLRCTEEAIALQPQFALAH